MADIRLNSEQWASISSDEQGRIEDAFKKIGAIEQNDRFVSDKGAVEEADWDPIGDLCRAVCDTAAAGAIAWCTANTGGPATAVCIAAAQAARKECRKRC